MRNTPYLLFLENVVFEQNLNEFLKSEPIIVQHDELNPMFWNSKQMLRKEIRGRMLEIANTFIKSLNIGDEKPPITDIVFTGSNANFNYTKTSDVDIHIRMDMSKFKTVNPVAAKTLYNKARAEYNKTRNIMLRGFKVEVFVEDIDTPPVGGGVFSIVKNRWLKPAERLSNDPNDGKFKRQVNKFVRQWAKDLKAAIATQDVDLMFDAFAKIKAQRGIGIDREGDGAPENAAYKTIRANKRWFDRLMGNTGLFDKMWSEIDRLKDERLSMAVPTGPLKEFFGGPQPIKYAKTLHKDFFGPDMLLKPEVRTAMLKIAAEFKAFLGLKNVKDIRFKGSMANYNYTSASDVDIHLIADVSPKTMEYFEAKRVEWKEKYKNIHIYRYPVELGVEPSDKVHSSSAVYSLSKNDWVDKPKRVQPETNLKRADEIYKTWSNRLSQAIESGDLAQIKKADQWIRGQRSLALPGSKDPNERRRMEMSDENVAYKRLRDTGVFEKIKAMYMEDKVSRLSLEKKNILLRLLGL